MNKAKSKCPFDDPDCLNCPYEECIATGKDISRQMAKAKQKYIAERNMEIVNAYKNGATREGLADRYGVSKTAITRVLNKNGVRERRRLIQRNENESDRCVE